MPVRRHWIPKPNKPSEHRALGIPTITDRIVQGAILNIIEPIFEARFFHVSFGFRPNRAVRDAIEQVRITVYSPKRDRKKVRRSLPYEWVIEGDIEKCFDNINHHALMNRLRKVVLDKRVCYLIKAFLKAGVLEELKLSPTRAGTPQGGILSPLLCNIALTAIEEHYSRWLMSKNGHQSMAKQIKAGSYNREYDRKVGRTIFYPIRYADDFVILCSGSEKDALKEKEALSQMLQQELGLTLSKEKTKVTHLSDGFEFLGHFIRTCYQRRKGWRVIALIPMNRRNRLRYKVKQLTRIKTTDRPLRSVLLKINQILRGWGYFYRHATSAGKAFRKIDNEIFWHLYRWLEKKHEGVGRKKLYYRYCHRGAERNWKRWAEDNVYCFRLSTITRGRWDLKKRSYPCYMKIAGDPGA